MLGWPIEIVWWAFRWVKRDQFAEKHSIIRGREGALAEELGHDIHFEVGCVPLSSPPNQFASMVLCRFLPDRENVEWRPTPPSHENRCMYARTSPASTRCLTQVRPRCSAHHSLRT